VLRDLLGVAGIEAALVVEWTRPWISEKMLAKAARSLLNACGVGLDTADGTNKEGPRFAGSNKSVFGG
jgi:hypothetical protein